MSTKQFYETLFKGSSFSHEVKELSFDHKHLPDGKFEIIVGYSEYGSEYRLSWRGHLITKEDIKFRKAIDIEKTDINEAIKLYKNIIESESTPIITYINASERISIILGKEKLYETDYYFLKNAYEIITKSSEKSDFGWFNSTIITKRLERAHKKFDK